jgi:two-component sensor histidine kinase
MLPVARAMPLGLMCYEILLNCFKHAFPDHQPGHLAVRLCRAGEHAEISISDDGIGYDEDTVSGGGMGTRLIRDLACEANVQVERLSRPNDGTSITLRVLHGGRS